MMPMITVFMRSEVFGYEEFPRSSIEEACETIGNLYRKSQEQCDGVEREIGIKLLRHVFTDDMIGQLWAVMRADKSIVIAKILQVVDADTIRMKLPGGSSELMDANWLLREADGDWIKQQYLQHQGARCFFCNSTDIEGGGYDADGDWHTIVVTCNECEATWKDLHTLNDVVEISDPWTNRGEQKAT
jgi:hypothetical protein